MPISAGLAIWWWAWSAASTWSGESGDSPVSEWCWLVVMGQAKHWPPTLRCSEPCVCPGCGHFREIVRKSFRVVFGWWFRGSAAERRLARLETPAAEWVGGCGGLDEALAARPPEAGRRRRPEPAVPVLSACRRREPERTRRPRSSPCLRCGGFETGASAPSSTTGDGVPRPPRTSTAGREGWGHDNADVGPPGERPRPGPTRPAGRRCCRRAARLVVRRGGRGGRDRSGDRGHGGDVGGLRAAGSTPAPTAWWSAGSATARSGSLPAWCAPTPGPTSTTSSSARSTCARRRSWRWTGRSRSPAWSTAGSPRSGCPASWRLLVDPRVLDDRGRGDRVRRTPLQAADPRRLPPSCRTPR